MKFFIFLFIMTPFFTLAQSEIEGIGQFKIGSATSSIISDISKEKRVKIKILSIYKSGWHHPLTKKTTKIENILYENSIIVANHQHTSVLPNVKVFFIDYYEISGIPFTNIYAKFYNDTLYSFMSDGDSELNVALKAKYGEARNYDIKNKISCISKVAGKFELEETTYVYEWINDLKAISAKYLLKDYYDSNCNKRMSSKFHIENTILATEIAALEINKKKEVEKLLLEEKKKQLKDF